jgi:CDGSH-type Zn-finger protein
MDNTVRITPIDNGPYLVEGDVQITDGAGAVVRETNKAYLCRCGMSATKPFCDGTHKREGWQSA